MNITNMVLLTNEQQIEFRLWNELFEHDGYKLWLQKAKDELANIESTILNTVEDERGLYYFKGQRSKLLSIVSLEKQTESYFQSLVGEVEYTTEEQEDSFGANA